MFTNDISVVKGEEALQKSEYSPFNTHIRYSKKVVDWTYEKRKSLIETTPRSAATRDYKSLAAEYIRLTRKEGETMGRLGVGDRLTENSRQGIIFIPEDKVRPAYADSQRA